MKTYHRRQSVSNPCFDRPAMGPSPVEVARRAGPCGDGKWAGFDIVYLRISRAAEKMGLSDSYRLSDVHINTMADLGSGHEERMKARLGWLMSYGWLTAEDLEETRIACEKLAAGYVQRIGPWGVRTWVLPN